MVHGRKDAFLTLKCAYGYPWQQRGACTSERPVCVLQEHVGYVRLISHRVSISLLCYVDPSLLNYME